jgi:transposase
LGGPLRGGRADVRVVHLGRCDQIPVSVGTACEEVLAFEPRKPGSRRRYTAEQKRLLLEEAKLPGSSISSVARRYGIAPNLLFHWKRQSDSGAQQALAAGEHVVPESEARLLKAKVRELERLLGKKTMETEILKEALEIARAKKWLPRGSSSGEDGGP